MKKILLVCIALAMVVMMAGCGLLMGGVGGNKPSTETAVHTVSFVTFGGSKVDHVEVNDNDIVPMPEDPIKEGSVFEGWYADPDFSYKWDFDLDTVVEDMRLYAKWSEAHKHTYTQTLTPGNCTETGYITYLCSCGDTYVEYDENGPKGHQYVVRVTEPTCTVGGYTTYTCSVCNDSYTDDELPARGHSYKYETVAPTCTEEGYTTKTCTVCGSSEVGGKVSATGHSYNETVTPPTCTEEGYTTKTCSVCSDVVIDAKVSATGHSYSSSITAPTCTVGGYTTYTCSACSDSYISGRTNPKGHTPGTAADCVNPQLCTVCGDTLAEPTGHTPGTAADCTTPQICTVCNETVAEALGHTPVTGTICTEATVCGRCGVTLERLDHSFAPATCLAPKTCTVCGYYEGEKGDHSYTATVTAPTCTADGYTTHTCSVCSDSYTDSIVNKTGHKYDISVVTEPTCTEGGYTTYTCSGCHNSSYVGGRVNPLGHSYVSKVVEPSCTAGGYTTYTCSRCDDSYTADVKEPLDHKYDAHGKCELCGEFNPDCVVITYVLNGGVNDENNVTTFLPGNTPTLYNPTHPSGYTFDGWYYDSAFTDPAPSLIGVTSDVTLYAKWIKVSKPGYSDGIETPEVPF